MELINIIMYSLLILIAALVVFIGISYIFTVVKNKNDKTNIVQQMHYQHQPQQYAIQATDGKIIRKEVKGYYDDQSFEAQPVIREEQIQPKPKIRRERREKRKQEKRKRVNRYSVVNNNISLRENSVAIQPKNYNSFDLNDYFRSYEDTDEGIYYNIKIGA